MRAKNSLSSVFETVLSETVFGQSPKQTWGQGWKNDPHELSHGLVEYKIAGEVEKGVVVVQFRQPQKRRCGCSARKLGLEEPRQPHTP